MSYANKLTRNYILLANILCQSARCYGFFSDSNSYMNVWNKCILRSDCRGAYLGTCCASKYIKYRGYDNKCQEIYFDKIVCYFYCIVTGVVLKAFCEDCITIDDPDLK